MPTVLVADDDEDILRLVSMNLELEGYRVLVARDGQQARDMCTAHGPDIVVLDVMMPEIDGLAVLSELKAADATKEIPVVLLSAKRTDAEVWAGWSAGADCYITKPFAMSELLHYLNLLSGTPPENPDIETDDRCPQWNGEERDDQVTKLLRSLGDYWGSEL